MKALDRLRELLGAERARLVDEGAVRLGRRRFLAALAAAPVVAVAGEALWTPGERAIALPPPGGWTGGYAFLQEVPPGTWFLEAEVRLPPRAGQLCSFGYDGRATSFHVDGVLVPHRLRGKLAQAGESGDRVILAAHGGLVCSR